MNEMGPVVLRNERKQEVNANVLSSILFFFVFQPCVIKIEDVYETADVLYIVLE